MVIDHSKDYIIQLAEYIKKNLSKGYTLDSLKVSLMNQGYSRIAINNAIDYLNNEMAKKAPPMIEKPQINYKIYPEKTPEKESFFKKFIKKFFR